MNLRLSMLETGYSVSAEEIESLNRSSLDGNDNNIDNEDKTIY